MLAAPAAAPGPIGPIARLLARGLEEHGCEVAILDWGSDGSGQSGVRRALDRLGDVLRARRAMRGGHFDAVLVHSSHDWGTLVRDLGLLGTCRRRPAALLQLHGSSPQRFGARGSRLFTAFSRTLVRRLDGLLVLSSEERKGWQQMADSVPVSVVANPYLPRAGAAGRTGGPGDPVRLLFVGRLVPKKGASLLLEAAAALPSGSVEVVVVGDGPDRARLEELAGRLGAAVTFTGRLARDSVDAAYREAHIFVLPSSWDEGFPTVISEAMDFGLPIVTTRIRGMVDHLEDGVNALLVTPGSLDELVGALERLVADGALREAMGRANHAAVRKFEPASVASQYLDALIAAHALRSDHSATG
ncbi:MAG TPA: glycosyltransferase family 4 protein [Acidimicrobiales bacterium]|nr:glycosyltransferase family 4 protein [Acidimicrobiales bacterium]